VTEISPYNPPYTFKNRKSEFCIGSSCIVTFADSPNYVRVFRSIRARIWGPKIAITLSKKYFGG
jgi:hypothetical protein